MVFTGVIEPEKRQILPSQHVMRKFLMREIIEKCNVVKTSVYRIKRQNIGEKPHAGGGLSKREYSATRCHHTKFKCICIYDGPY